MHHILKATFICNINKFTGFPIGNVVISDSLINYVVNATAKLTKYSSKRFESEV